MEKRPFIGKELIGEVLKGRYEVVGFLGEGGMGAVLKGRDLEWERDVAIKVLHPDKADDPEQWSHLRRRFKEREWPMLVALSHSGIVRVWDFDDSDPYLFIVMDFIDGENLREFLRGSKPIELPSALELVREVCRAIAYAHREGWVHRDIKPSNIMLKKKKKPSDEFPYSPILTDMGLAKKLADESELETKTHPSDPITDLFLRAPGTPGYMAPEQVLNKDIDERTDIYLLGILLYELVVGERPFSFEGGTTGWSDAIQYYMKKPPELPPSPRLKKPDLPREVERIILIALQLEPDDRYSSAEEMRDELDKAPKELEDGEGQEPGHVYAIEYQRPDGETDKRSPPEVDQELTIERADDNELVIDDPDASSHHAQVEFDGRKFWVRALESGNDTRLGDTPLLAGVPYEWTPEQELRIGQHRLSLVDESQRPGPPFTSELRPHRIEGQQGTVGVEIENRGNAPQTYTITCEDPDDRLEFTPPRGELTLPAGETREMEFIVERRSRWPAIGEQSHPFSISVSTPETEEASHEGKLVSPGIPIWVPPVLIGLGLLLIAGAVLGNLLPPGNTPTPTPTSTNKVSSAQVQSPSNGESVVPTSPTSPISEPTSTWTPTIKPLPTPEPTSTSKPTIPPPSPTSDQSGCVSYGGYVFCIIENRVPCDAPVSENAKISGLEPIEGSPFVWIKGSVELVEADNPANRYWKTEWRPSGTSVWEGISLHPEDPEQKKYHRSWEEDHWLDQWNLTDPALDQQHDTYDLRLAIVDFRSRQDDVAECVAVRVKRTKR